MKVTWLTSSTKLQITIKMTLLMMILEWFKLSMFYLELSYHTCSISTSFSWLIIPVEIVLCLTCLYMFKFYLFCFLYLFKFHLYSRLYLFKFYLFFCLNMPVEIQTFSRLKLFKLYLFSCLISLPILPLLMSLPFQILPFYSCLNIPVEILSVYLF